VRPPTTSEPVIPQAHSKEGGREEGMEGEVQS
jgi:hypothetical protein